MKKKFNYDKITIHENSKKNIKSSAYDKNW